MARYVNGRDFRLYVLDQDEYKIAACLTDCDFTLTQGTIPITSRSTGFWSHYDYTTRSWSASATGVFFIQRVNGGITPFEIVDRTFLDSFEKLQIRFKLYDREGYGKNVEGEVLVEEMNFQGGTDDFAVFAIQMRGNGPLLIYDTLESCGIIDANGDLLVDSDGSFLVDNCGSFDTIGEFDPAEFSEIDFI